MSIRTNKDYRCIADSERKSQPMNYFFLESNHFFFTNDIEVMG